MIFHLMGRSIPKKSGETGKCTKYFYKYMNILNLLFPVLYKKSGEETGNKRGSQQGRGESKTYPYLFRYAPSVMYLWGEKNTPWGLNTRMGYKRFFEFF